MGDGKPLTLADDAILTEVGEADLVLIGMSSNADLAREEFLVAGAAKNSSVPWGAYGDVPGCFSRVSFWPKGLAESAKFYLCPDETDASNARATFTGAKVFATGNPLREDMFFPRFARGEVRDLLQIALKEKLVLLGGGKSVFSNMARLAIVTEAIAGIQSDGLKFKLVISLHPGDRLPFAVDPEGGKGMGAYQELVKDSPIPFIILRDDPKAEKTEIVCSNCGVLALPAGTHIGTGDIVVGSDLVIAGLAGSTAIEAAAKRVPAICLGGEVDMRKLQKEIGSRVPEAARLGVASQCSMRQDLGLQILSCVGGDGNPFLSAQEREFPIPARGEAVNRAVAALKAVLSGAPATT